MLSRTVLMLPLAAAIALAGCLGTDTQRSETGDDPRGPSSIGTVGNATGGSATTLAPAGATLPPGELANATRAYVPGAPEALAFVVDQSYARLVATASAEGFILGLRVVLVDPSGAETVLAEGYGSPVAETSWTESQPAPGTWWVRFEGSGPGSVTVTVRGE